MIDISPIEGLWLGVTVAAIIWTLDNLRDAYRSWLAVRGTTRLRFILARGGIRREAVRLVIDASLLVLVIPALFRPGDTPLSWGLVVIMLVPIGMALNSFLDRRDRQTLIRMTS